MRRAGNKGISHFVVLKFLAGPMVEKLETLMLSSCGSIEHKWVIRRVLPVFNFDEARILVVLTIVVLFVC